MKCFRVVFVFCRAPPYCCWAPPYSCFYKPKENLFVVYSKNIQNSLKQIFSVLFFITIRAFFVEFLTLYCWCLVNVHTYVHLKPACLFTCMWTFRYLKRIWEGKRIKTLERRSIVVYCYVCITYSRNWKLWTDLAGFGWINFEDFEQISHNISMSLIDFENAAIQNLKKCIFI